MIEHNFNVEWIFQPQTIVPDGSEMLNQCRIMHTREGLGIPKSRSPKKKTFLFFEQNVIILLAEDRI